jgi:AAA domain/UvrD-like helicase C-terminal domain
MEYHLEFSKGSVTLNEEQYTVVTSPIHENQRILASAGSGKTTTITSRIAYLVEEYDLDPRRILLVSFSRAAAQEMIHRVHRLLGPIPMYAGTFHSLSHQILKEHAPHLLRDQPFMDELPYRLATWLQTEPAKRWTKNFRTIIVDEFQDINEIQWTILQRLYHPRATMTIVGDDAQNIYTWRGSSVDFILRFHERIPRVKDYQLCRNYRSTEAIVTIANAVMRFIPTLPFKERMVAHTAGGRIPEVHYFFRAADEYDWIVNSLEKGRRQHPTLTFAVLSRYNSDLYRLEERLHRKGISYLLCTDPDKPVDSGGAARPDATLATIHGSKGLEWDVVFFMNLHDDVFPSRKAEEEVVCERRLFYVGVTRARQALFLTYSKQERALSRFVREIPRPFLCFHNVTSFKLSTTEFQSPTMSLEDQLRGLDGGDWTEWRKRGWIPQLSSTHSEAMYPFATSLAVPQWVKRHDVRPMWTELLRLVLLRESARHCQQMAQLQTPVITEGLLTLRIYREDIEFWTTYEAELEQMAHHFLKHTPEMPAVEYVQLDAYLRTKLKHIEWTVQERCHALVILSKIRGQLRPLRHTGFDLSEFSFGVVRNSVPTESRPEVLASWHRYADPAHKSSDILGDMWRIAALSFVVEGRNVPLYQTREVLPFLLTPEHRALIQQVEAAIPDWIARQCTAHPLFHFLFEVEHLQPLSVDLLTDKWIYHIHYEPTAAELRMEDKILLLLKQYAYEESYDRCLTGIATWNMATGSLTEYEVTPTIREQISQMWLHLQQKYETV